MAEIPAAAVHTAARYVPAEQRLHALSAQVLRDEPAGAAMGPLVDDATTIEPYGEPHDARHWREQSEVLAHGVPPTPPYRLHPVEHEPLLPQPRSGAASADSVKEALGPLSGLAELVRRLTASSDRDVGAVVRPDPGLAAAGGLPCRPDGTSRPA
ncbi:hypothetical protein [Streptomyces sp. WM6378]|uniref:hypothetical protein n=1 Tax=Streptomyces sp. WM6378 TaxID=1415557 RepID=UPI0006AFCDD6|nr:hypothetical protein [Streptomyces sp. WM6378]KOU42826.1 hypothetical protein ADK54_18510 [Streptomyces sp. WM6378]